MIASERYADWLLWNVPSLRGHVAYDVRFELNTGPQLRAIYDFRNVVDRQRAARGYRLVVLDGEADRTAAHLLHGRTLYADRRITVLER